MPSNVTVKTVSGLKQYGFLSGIILVLAVILVIELYPRHNNTDSLKSNGHTYTLMLAKTEQAQEKGLGYRSSLPKNQGMVFVFADEQVRCFWMKDMHFSLDMIWLNSQKRVNYIQYNATPASYPSDFCPTVPAQYVIELNAGQTKVAGIQEGERLSF